MQYYKEKNIKTLKLEDVNVAISGFVLSISNNSILIDDGDTQITLIYSNLENIKENTYIRAFGTLVNLDNNLTLQTHFIQDLSNIDMHLHKKIKNLLSK